MNKISKKTRRIALLLLGIWCYNLVAPAAAYALTSGPSQPEVKGFQPAGVSDMVDLQTGDFKYNIPLLDIDGYPINLNYQSGTGVDDEASWVGLGWSLNVGSINRQVRGVPDDMDGDEIKTEHYTKPKITVGGKVTVKGELAGGDIPVGLQGSFSMGVFNDNYTGIGAEIGANAGISASLSNDGSLTAGLGVGLLSNTQSGVDVTPYANLGIKYSSDFGLTSSAGLSASLGYNTRSGLKNLSLNCSFGPQYLEGVFRYEGTLISYNTEPIFPKIQVPYKSSYGSFSMDLGVNYGIAFAGTGGAGYVSVKEVISRINTNPAYGSLYAEHGKNVKNAVMDFVREKDNPILPELPNLAIPVNTVDLFSYTSQAGSGQFRLHRGGTGAFFDPEVADQSSTATLGFDAGAGGYVHGGTTFFKQKTTNTTRKWASENNYLANGDFQDIDMNNPDNQHVYFKKVGELTREDAGMSGLIHNTEPLAVKISGSTATNTFESYPSSNLSRIMKTKREPLQTSISYLTANEAAVSGLDKKINTYSFNSYGNFSPPALHKPIPLEGIKRVDTGDPANFRKGNHISEMTVTDEHGKKMVYGIPVYSRQQDEYTFAVGKGAVMETQADNFKSPDQLTFPYQTNAATFSSNKGIDSYYHKESQPAHATSFLLTGILSPDYVDKKGDGISDDDLGTAIKFNYSRLDAINWRTPYKNATLNKSLLADEDDDKANIVFGTKEQYYVSSIESKTKIAYFITENRNDAIGVLDYTGGVASSDPSPRQKCLREIRLYSKADMTKPIKVVKLKYDYSLCPNTPNSVSTLNGIIHGKLTLTDVHFEYGNTTKGVNFPYVFSYNTSYTDAIADPITHLGHVQTTPAILGYKTQNTDRWGTFRPHTDIPGFTVENDEFPYTAQELTKGTVTTSVGTAASLWHLNQITLPTGGVIKVNYESDDYAYVQDKKAMYMSPILDLQTDATPPTDETNTTRANLVDAKVITLQLPAGTATDDNTDATAAFKRDFLNGSDYIYIKAYVDVGTSNSTHTWGKSFDFVPCFAEISQVSYTNHIARIRLKDRTEGGGLSNPIVVSAWQKMKEEYPRYAYPGFDRRMGNEGATQSLASAVQAIFNAFGNLSELTENFYHKAARVRYAGTMDYAKSFARIVKQDGFKLGGGVRVKSVVISDSWNTMSGGANTHSYGQNYDYTTTDGTQVISSGVASYEPSVGNDENPLKQPIFYVQQVRGGINNFFDLEEPFGESFYPAPAVNYSKVTVTDINPDQVGAAAPLTGYTVNEFYTAKDFPVRVTVIPIQRYNPHPPPHFSIVSGSSTEKMVLSQGYAIELNDMAGKTKSVKIYNQSGAEISATVYNYNTTPSGSGPIRLANTVNILNTDGTVSQNQVIGRDVDFFTDFREQESINDGKSVDVGVDVIPAFGYPVPIPHFPGSANSEYKLFRSVCAVKVSQYYGIVKSVIKTVNGSSIITENLAYDGLTGEPVVTRTQNEFNNDIFSVNIPAYWAYSGMGPAYQSQGMVLTGVTTGLNGVLTGQAQLLKDGDEFIDLDDNTGGPFWVVKDYVSFPFTPGTAEYVINKYGQTIAARNFNRIKVINSGYKNILASGLSSLVCLKNPLVPVDQAGNLKLALNNADLKSFKFINASAQTYRETWSTEVPDIHVLPVINPLYDFTLAGGGTEHITSNGTHIVFGYEGGSHKYTTSDLLGGDPVIGHYFDNRAMFSSILDVNNSLINYTNSNTMGAFGTFYAPRAGTYYVGFDSSVMMSWGFDCGIMLSLESQENPGNFGWTIVQVDLTKGNHTINMELRYNGVQINSPGGGIEIYNNTLDEIKNAGDGSNINMIWNSKSLITTPGTSVYVKPGGVADTTYNSAYSDAVQTPFSPCKVPIKSINPYLYGFLGNWRPYETKVFQQNRVYNNILNGANNVADVKNAGYLDNFVPYWLQPAALGLPWLADNTTSKWVTANTVTGYDKYGQEIENKDALIRFSAAMFDFNGELPAAVASNARNREIYANSFEDVNFKPGQATYFDPPKINDFLDENGHTIKSLAQNTDAHSGNYSTVLPARGVTMRTVVYNAEANHVPWLLTDAAKQLVKNTNSNNYGIYPNGFEPMFGSKQSTGTDRKYVFNAWVKDSNPYDRTLAMTLSVNGNSTALTVKAVVEGWKLVEGVIDLTLPAFTENSALEILIKPTAGASVSIDDIRMHPFDAQMKSYVYDESTLRLMAELDENGFTSFYEYDSEGLLVRVKKETERGIVTLKETRSSQKKSL